VGGRGCKTVSRVLPNGRRGSGKGGGKEESKQQDGDVPRSKDLASIGVDTFLET